MLVGSIKKIRFKLLLVLACLVNASCSPFEAMNDLSVISEEQLLSSNPDSSTPTTSQLPTLLNARIQSFKNSTNGSQLVLKSYVDEYEKIFSDYYGEPVSNAFVEIDGRSLLKDFENFAFRRKLVKFTIGSGSLELPVAFLAFSPFSDEFEIIAWDKESSRYEFLLAKNVKQSSNDIVKTTLANRKTCTACHQSGGGVFPRAPWGETHFLKDTAFIFSGSAEHARSKNEPLYNFLNQGLEISIPRSELTNTRSVTIPSFKDTVESFDTAVRNTNTVIASATAVKGACAVTDSDCKQRLLNSVFDGLESPHSIGLINRDYNFISTIIPDYVPQDLEGFVLANSRDQTLFIGALSPEDITRTYTLDPLVFNANDNFVAINHLRSQASPSLDNPLLPSTARPSVDQVDTIGALEELASHQVMQKFVFGFSKSDLNVSGINPSQVPQFLSHIAKVNVWPITAKIYFKYLNRFKASDFTISNERSPSSYATSNDAVNTNNNTSIIEGINSPFQKLLVKNCQECHTSESLHPIDFSNETVVFNYKNNNTSLGRNILDTVKNRTMPPSNSSVTPDYNEQFDSLVNYLER